MRTSEMFHLTKTVLQKVSFNPPLFYKELQKAINQLLPYDLQNLCSWVNSFVKNKPELKPTLALLPK
ncbi:hypothetical protein [Myroides sp. LJL119]